MSVRKNAVKPRPQAESGAWRFVRATLFWLFLLLASFVVGALVISPLLNKAAGSGRSETVPAAPSATADSPPPSPAPRTQPSLLPPLEERRPSRADDEPIIRITPEESESRSLQESENLDGSNATNPDTPDLSNRTGRVSGVGSRASDSADQTPDPRLPTARPGPPRSFGVRASDEDRHSARRPPPSKRRARRSDQTAPQPAAPSPPPIQQGEPIDE